ncbi:hypothetical protein L0337_03580 [candidate division KSB1 bacterium]|nr:hypothetical protein [candidate division KSB1 bacterium]
MTEQTSETLVCGHCKNPITESDEFCPKCGSIFEDNVFCANHPERDAKGVCIICCEALCAECGGRVNDLFLCKRHWQYEIIEGMARVFGSNDTALLQYAKSCLEQEGLHPFLFSRKATAFAGGAPEWTLFRSAGDYNGHFINEFKVLVPCQEVIKAERVLTDLKFIERKERS